MRKLLLIVAGASLLWACGNEPKEELNAVKDSVEEVSEEPVLTSNVQPVNDVVEDESDEDGYFTQEGIGSGMETPTTDQVEANEEEVAYPPKEELKTGNEPVEEPVKPTKPNHSEWGELLLKYVSAKGKVNYTGFKSKLPELTAYLKHLEEVSPKSDWSRNEKLAYWINLYNASTVYLVASNYPVKSITDISGGKPWDKKFVKSGDKIYTLNEIENKIIRPTFNEPRIHVALNCAAVSCPTLMNSAFLPNKLNMQFDRQAKLWINDSSKNVISANTVKLSKIFEWYGDDFKKDGIINWVNKYANTKAGSTAKIEYMEYNWGLNE